LGLVQEYHAVGQHFQSAFANCKGNECMALDNDFYEGFRQGLRALCGDDAPLPALAELPARLTGRTLFQTGLIRGIEHAKGWEEGSLLSKI
jgi:hypothetical protein